MEPSGAALDPRDDPEPSPRPRRNPLGWIAASVALLIAVVGGYELVTYSLTYPRTWVHPDAGTDGLPRAYYLDWRTDWSDLDHLRLCARDGVLETPRSTRVDGRLIPDPIGVIQGGLALHDQLLDGPNPERERILRNQLDWLAASAVWLPDSIPVWPCYWRADEYSLEGPWISAMTQGQAISLLVRGASYFEEPSYLRLAGDALSSLRDTTLPIIRTTPEGEILFEEYPSVPPSLVLNGALCTWLGVWDYWRATGDPDAEVFAMSTLQAMETRIANYELGDWTRYDLIKTRPVSPAYQEIHAALAEAIHAITDLPSWGDRAARWRRAADKPEVRVQIFFQVLLAKVEGYWGGARARPHPHPQPMPEGLNRNAAGSAA